MDVSTLPLVAAQSGIFIADQLSEFNNAYGVVHFLDIEGELNVSILFEAIMDGMGEFDTLRMLYTTDRRGDPIQILKGPEILPYPEFYDMRSNLQAATRNSDKLMSKDMNNPCRIGSGSQLIRHIVMQLDDNKFRWYQRFHHIQLDAYSFTALTRRISAIYSAKIRGEDWKSNMLFNGSSAPDPFFKVVDEYMQYRDSPKFLKDAEFWRDFCASLPDAASICPQPLANVEPSKNIIRNFTVLSAIDFNNLVKQMTTSNKKLSNVDIALALLSVWLLRLSNKNSMTAGFIFMRRLGSAALNASGPFINILPLPIELCGSLADTAGKIAANLRSMRKHQKYDSENIVRESGRSWDIAPLYGPVINFKAFDYNLDFESLASETHHIASGPVRDLELVLYINEEGAIRVEYLANSARYSAESLDNHLSRLHSLLYQFTVQPNVECTLVDITLPSESNMLESLNNTDFKLEGPFISKSYSLMDLVVYQAEQTPTAIALCDDSLEFKQGLSYSDMISEVNHFANRLAYQGVRPGDIVAVALPRSVYLSLSIQAISLLGAAWLPLDPCYPWERLKLMIQDANPTVIVSNDKIFTDGNLEQCGIPVLHFESLARETFSASNGAYCVRDLVNRVDSDMNAYIIYTSGSTGKPKGVLVGHMAIVNRLLWMKREFNIDSTDVILQKTSVCFDVSVWELFLPLISGSKLVMAPPDAHRDPNELKRLIFEHGISTIHFVPSMLATFMATNNTDFPWAGKLKRVFCSGEALPVKSVRTWNVLTRDVPLYNLYGPTEAAIDVTYAASRGYGQGVYVPIGVPVWNTKLYVLDKKLQPVPMGIAGDLFISGVQLANGYLNLPALTSERFVTHQGVRMYRTGDIARWLPGSEGLEFLGRSDDQVKLRGQRIELGEIDAMLENMSGIQQAVTLALPNPHLAKSDLVDSRQLVSYYVGDDETSSYRLKLMQQLPSYMVPVKIIRVEEFPISASGKLNKRALPPAFSDPGDSSESDNSTHARREPSDGLEQNVAQAFQKVLGCSKVYADDDFFSLGGHSLMAVKLATNLRSSLNLPITIGQIMQNPRVDALAAQLSDLGNVSQWENAGFEDVMPLGSVVPTTSSIPKRTLYCIHPASGFSWQFSVLSRYLDASNWNVVGIQSAREEGPLGVANNLDDVVTAHLKTLLSIHDPQEPFFLLGYSLGGTLAHSLASRLLSIGRRVAFLGLLDTWPPETQNWNAKRERNEVDQAVIDEMQREREQFLSASSNGDTTSRRMFDVIETNYASAVNILATAKSSRFEGTSTLFVAQKTLPNNTELQDVWKPYSRELKTHLVDCSHVDIVSPVVFKKLGPQINAILSQID